MSLSNRPSPRQEQADALARALVWEMARLDRKLPQHPSAWNDFDRLGSIAVGLGAFGARELVHARYPARAIVSQRWRALASCCQLGLLQGHIAIQAYLGDSLAHAQLGAPLADPPLSDHPYQHSPLAQLNFCAEAILADETDPPNFNTQLPGLGARLWLELAMDSALGAQAADHAAQRVPAFDPMGPVLSLAATPNGRARLREHASRLGPVLASAPGFLYQADMGILLWLRDILGSNPLALPLASKLLASISAMGSARIASGMLDRADLLGPARLDSARDAFNVSPLHILHAATSAMALSSENLFTSSGPFRTQLPNISLGWAWAQIDHLGPTALSLLASSNPTALDWPAWRLGAIAFGRWEAAAALPADSAQPEPTAAVFAHGVACILLGRSFGAVSASFAPGGALRSFALNCLLRQPNSSLFCAKARKILSAPGLGLDSHIEPTLAWLAEIGSLAERSSVDAALCSTLDVPTRAPRL